MRPTSRREVVSLVAVLAAAAVVYLRPLHDSSNSDEGVYLATMRELHHGTAIGDVFLSQPPGFGWLLDLLGAFTGSLTTIRVVILLFALAGCAAAWAIGARIGGAVGGALAGATLAIAAPWPAYATRLEADLPSTSLAVVSLALVSRWPLLAGGVFALAVSVKLLAVSAAVPLVLLARRRIPALLGGAAVVAVVVALSVASQLGRVWSQAVVFHLHGRRGEGPSTSANVDRVLHFLSLRSPLTVLVAAAVCVAVLGVVRHRPVPWELWTWVPASAVVLVAQRPLLDHHMVLLAASFAVPAGATLASAAPLVEARGRLVAVAAAAAVVAAGFVQQWRQLAPDGGEPADVRRASAWLREVVGPGAVVASDLQIVPYLAGDRQPPQLVDTSAVRLDSGNLSASAILADSAHARAFVVGRELIRDAALRRTLAGRYPRRARIGSITIYVRARAVASRAARVAARERRSGR